MHDLRLLESASIQGVRRGVELTGGDENCDDGTGGGGLEKATSKELRGRAQLGIETEVSAGATKLSKELARFIERVRGLHNGA